MIEVNGKKLSQDEVNLLLVQACNQGNLNNVVKAVEEWGANVNATDKLGYARALIYALRSCGNPGDTGELIVKYLVNKGAEVDFKHGDKGSNMESRPYYIYYAANNPLHISDDLVYFLIKNSNPKNLTYVPTTKIGSQHGSIVEEIKKYRPKLYEKLLQEKIITNKSSR